MVVAKALSDGIIRDQRSPCQNLGCGPKAANGDGFADNPGQALPKIGTYGGRSGVGTAARTRMAALAHSFPCPEGTRKGGSPPRRAGDLPRAIGKGHPSSAPPWGGFWREGGASPCRSAPALRRSGIFNVRPVFCRPVDIYLDIDGVLIRDGRVTPHCFEFLRWAVKSHRPFWLTTRDAHGEHDGILRAFRHALGTATLAPEIEALLAGGTADALARQQGGRDRSVARFCVDRR